MFDIRFMYVRRTTEGDYNTPFDVSEQRHANAAGRMKALWHVTCRMLLIKKRRFRVCFVQNIRYLVGTSDVTTISNNREHFLQISCKTSLKKPEYRCVVQMHGSEHMRHFRWFQSDAVVFRLYKVFSSSLQHIWQTFTINWSKIQLSWVLLLYYPYKTMFSAYRSLIVSPCACDLFVSKVTKITRYIDVRLGWSFFGTFSVCNDCILKSTTAWLLKLSVLYIHSFMQVHNTTFQIKTIFNNVHNPLHAHLLAPSHMT